VAVIASCSAASALLVHRASKRKSRPAWLRSTGRLVPFSMQTKLKARPPARRTQWQLFILCSTSLASRAISIPSATGSTTSISGPIPNKAGAADSIVSSGSLTLCQPSLPVGSALATASQAKLPSRRRRCNPIGEARNIAVPGRSCSSNDRSDSTHQVARSNSTGRVAVHNVTSNVTPYG